MRLIDADKFEAFVIRTNGDEEFINGVQYVLERIDNAPTVNAIPLPDDATNGDAILAVFPDAEPYQNNGVIETDIDGGTLFHEDWWNAPYNGGNENE